MDWNTIWNVMLAMWIYNNVMGIWHFIIRSADDAKDVIKKRDKDGR